MTYSTQLLNELLREKAAADDSLREARERRDFVFFAATQFPGATGTKIPSGSVAHGTVIGEVDDADGTIVIDRRQYPAYTPDGGEQGPTDIVEEVASFIRPIIQDAYPEAWVYLNGRKRSIYINFREELPNGDNPTVDLIVGFNRKEGDGVWIPNLKNDTWEPSDSRRHTELVHAAHKATQRTSTHIIRLGKLYTKQWLPPLLHSFNVTALALSAVTEKKDLGEAFADLLSYAAGDIARRNTPDQAGVSVPIKLPAKYERDYIVGKLTKAAERMVEANDTETTLEEATNLLCKVFRKYEDILRNAAKKLEIEEGMKASALGVRGGSFVAAAAAVRPVRATTAFGGRRPRGSSKRPWGKSGPWFGNERDRIRFEKSIEGSGYTMLSKGKRGRLSSSRYEYLINIPVEPYSNYPVRVIFAGELPRVFADSLANPRHHYEDGSLCMWHPFDERARRWEHHDGLLELCDIIKTHLFKELRFRETKCWIGDEVHHNE